MAAITEGVQSPNLQFRDSTTNKSVSVNELRDAVDQTATNTSNISTFNNELATKSNYVENRFKGNQNWNVAGKDGHPIPSASPYTYPAGDEIVAGIVATTECVDVTRIAGVVDGDSGIYTRTYEGEFPNDHYGIKLADNTIVQTGVTFNAVTNTTVSVDFSLAPAHKFVGLSSDQGAWADINDGESRNALKSVSRAFDFAWANVITASLSLRSLNIGVVQKIGVGRYRLFFVEKPDDTRYAIIPSASGTGNAAGWPTYDVVNKTTDYFDVVFSNMGAGGSTYTYVDPVEFSVSVKWGE